MNEYINDIRREGLVTKQEFLTIFEQFKRGCLASKDALIRANLRLVLAVIRRYRTSGVDQEDLVQEGNIGIILALERYNPDLGEFSTYANIWIRQRITKFLAESKTVMHIPYNAMGDYLRGDGKTKRTGRVSLELVHKAMIARRLEKYELDNLEKTKVREVSSSYNEDIDRFLSCLNSKKKEVIIRYFGLCGYEAMNSRELADFLGITHQGVWFRINSGIEILRKKRGKKECLQLLNLIKS